MQTIGRKGTFDSGHRVMNECMKCFNVHGHTYMYELVFQFDSMQEIGYAIDFKEIKRVGCQWIDDMLDHGMLLNVKDQVLKDAVDALKSKMWIMSLNGMWGYCNPTVENIAKEIFLAMRALFKGHQGLEISEVILYETPNCYTVCKSGSISVEEEKNWNKVRFDEVRKYAKEKGTIEYDDRKVQK